ncbi:unnamed protein product, partial [Vitis vinifera]
MVARRLSPPGQTWMRFQLKSNDENIGNHIYIYIYIYRYFNFTDISEIYQHIFWKKILISLKLIKICKNIRKTS